MSTNGSAAPQAADIKPATGKLGIMIPGMGAVATTLIAGVEAVRRGFAKPIGSMSQMGTIRLGKRTDDNTPLIKDWAPIADLNDIVFTGWDIFGGNLYDAAKTANVLDRDQLESMRPFLESIEPMPAVFDQRWARRQVAELQRGGVRQIHDAIVQERAAIVHAHDHRLAVLHVRHQRIAGDRQRRMRGRHRVHVVDLAGRRALTVELAPYHEPTPRCR